jgi:GT2 family glycosyltransferase
MWRRSVHQDVGFFDESFVALGDQDFWLRLGASQRLLHIPVATGLYWRSSEGLSNRPEIANPEEARLRARYGCWTASTPAPAAVDFDCSIIIPVWNKRELTEQCLTELARVTSGISYEVIIVDNNSTDDTAYFLNQLSGDIQIIRNSENLGFAKACNQGARAARGRFLVFLNNDTIPLENWLTALVAEVTSHPDIGIVGSKLLYEKRYGPTCRSRLLARNAHAIPCVSPLPSGPSGGQPASNIPIRYGGLHADEARDF